MNALGGGASSTEQAPAPKGPPSSAIVDITDSIALNTSFSTNVDPRFPMENLFRGDERLVCKSDCDEQAIFHFKFKSKMKLHSLYIRAPKEGEDEEQMAPKIIKLYVNRNAFSFDDGDDEDGIEPTQVLTLSSSDVTGNVPLLLQTGKFSSVSSLTMFVQTNQCEGEEDYTIMSGLKVIGSPLDNVDFNDWKPVKG